MPVTTNLQTILAGLFAQLKTDIEESGDTAVRDWNEIRRYAAERAEHLSTIVGQPGYAYAVTAERDSIALKAAISAVDLADETESRWLGMIQGALIALAHALTLGLDD